MQLAASAGGVEWFEHYLFPQSDRPHGHCSYPANGKRAGFRGLAPTLGLVRSILDQPKVAMVQTAMFNCSCPGVGESRHWVIIL